MGCQWKELPIEKDRDGHPEFITREFTAPFEDGKPMVVLTPFSPVCIDPSSSRSSRHDRHSWGWNDNGGEERWRQHWVQRPQENERR